MAAQAEDVGHLLADQVVDDDLAAVEHIACRHRSGLLTVSCNVIEMRERMAMGVRSARSPPWRGRPPKPRGDAISHNAAGQLILWEMAMRHPDGGKHRPAFLPPRKTAAAARIGFRISK